VYRTKRADKLERGEKMLLKLWTFLSIALESFPISSSGHAHLITEYVAAWFALPALQIPYRFDHFLHGATVIVLPLVFYSAWRPLLNISRSYPILIKLLCLGFIVELCTAAVYFMLEYFDPTLPLWLGFFITGALLISLRFCVRENGEWDYRLSLLLGFAQGLALFPGISRLGITYVVARWYDVRPIKAAQISFLIEWPIALAGFFKGLYSLNHATIMQQLLNLNMLLVIVIAMIIMYFSLRLFLLVVEKKKVWLFGIYVWAVALITFII
jgi:undecaprenyl-diphosphatase